MRGLVFSAQRDHEKALADLDPGDREAGDGRRVTPRGRPFSRRRTNSTRRLPICAAPPQLAPTKRVRGGRRKTPRSRSCSSSPSESPAAAPVRRRRDGERCCGGIAVHPSRRPASLRFAGLLRIGLTLLKHHNLMLRSRAAWRGVSKHGRQPSISHSPIRPQISRRLRRLQSELRLDRIAHQEFLDLAGDRHRNSSTNST